MSLSSGEAYDRYAEELVRFATGLVGPDDAQDVVAEVFVRVMRTSRWAGVENHRASLYRAGANEAATHHRSTLRRRARERRQADHSVTHLPEVRPEVLEALGRLSARQRAVVVLTYWNDLAPPRVASLLGISDGSVRRHLARARAALREVLDE
jgi:RNA polymerase sigma factor (sigma-70 family)